MRRSSFLVLLSFAACGAPPPIREVHPSPAAASISPSMPDDDVVAFLNGKAITRREVADHALATDGKGLIDQFIRWKVRTDRVRELGISNSADELKARGRAILENFRLSQGDAAYKHQLAEAGLSEDEYVARFATTPEFSDRLSLEKAFLT